MEKIFQLKGMHCKSCEQLLKMELEEINGVKVLEASSKTNQVKISMDSDMSEAIKQKIVENKYKVIS
ncbi:heavy-metal-associated domain-containing protein [Candidatus Micrarchaeota archaeon]|nr:heavy-metal-associated domain-containing protein [Candidatus Micrarchaeota archaeon]